MHSVESDLAYMLKANNALNFVRIMSAIASLIFQAKFSDFDNSCFSSPEPLGSQGELIVYPLSRRPSVVYRPSVVHHFQRSTTWPIRAKFYVEHLWEGGTKVYINSLVHMTKMAAMPIYGKNL